MPPVDRNRPVRAKSSQSRYSIMEFTRQFPDDEACLRWLWHSRFSPDGETAQCPKCERQRRFHRLSQLPAYSCDSCGHHLHPTAGTIFHKSSTALWLWFYAMYLASSTRCGISAKQLERQIGVTYKTAWRMLNLIRSRLMDQDGDSPLLGNVEVDETYYGGKPRAADIRRNQRALYPKQAGVRWAQDNKTMVFGMVERGGRIRAVVPPKDSTLTFKQTVGRYVLPASVIFTDEHPSYKGLERSYAAHRRIRHKANIYVDGDVHTQTIEGFFGLLKNGIRGTYHSVSSKWLQSYLNEFTWRYNHRDDTQPQFTSLLLRACEA